MKRYRFTFLKVIALVVILSLLSACSNNQNKGDDSSAGSPNYIEDEIADGESTDSPQADMEEQGKADSLLQGDKVISTYYMTLETMDFENARKDLDALIKKHKSFVENSNIGFRGYEYSRNYRYGDFSIRIPKENLELFKTELKEIGNIINESVNQDDVSKYYRDNESRLKLVTAKEKRLLELLEKAVKIEDIIAIESELTDTIYEKEMLEGELKSIDEKIEYTTLNLNLIEVRSFSNTAKADSSLLIRLKAAFRDSLFAFKIALENFIIWIVFVLPYLVIIIPIIILIVFFIKKFRNKS